jgi:hypothetical protein
MKRATDEEARRTVPTTKEELSDLKSQFYGEKWVSRNLDSLRKELNASEANWQYGKSIRTSYENDLKTVRNEAGVKVDDLLKQSQHYPWKGKTVRKKSPDRSMAVQTKMDITNNLNLQGEAFMEKADKYPKKLNAYRKILEQHAMQPLSATVDKETQRAFDEHHRESVRLGRKIKNNRRKMNFFGGVRIPPVHFSHH